MNIIEYIILGFGILFTFVWCLNVRERVKREQKTDGSMEIFGFLMTFSIVIILLLPLSPLHLLWMIPASFILGLISPMTPVKVLWIFSSIYFSLWYIGVSNEGRRLYLAGEYKKAIEYFKKELAKKPSSAEAYFYLGRSYGKIGEHDKEIEAYQKAIKLLPPKDYYKKTVLYFDPGIALYKIGDIQRAIEALKQAITLKPDYLEARYKLCEIYSLLGDYENARREFEIVKKLNSNIAKAMEVFINKK